MWEETTYEMGAKWLFHRKVEYTIGPVCLMMDKRNGPHSRKCISNGENMINKTLWWLEWNER